MQAIAAQPQRAPDGAPVHYERHRPEQTILYRLVQQHAATFIAEAEAIAGAELPQFVKDRPSQATCTPLGEVSAVTKIYTAVARDGTTVQWRDRKRAWWAMSVVWPLIPFTGVALHAASGYPIASLTLLDGEGRPAVHGRPVFRRGGKPFDVVDRRSPSPAQWLTAGARLTALVGSLESCGTTATVHRVSSPVSLLLRRSGRHPSP